MKFDYEVKQAAMEVGPASGPLYSGIFLCERVISLSINLMNYMTYRNTHAVDIKMNFKELSYNFPSHELENMPV